MLAEVPAIVNYNLMMNSAINIIGSGLEGNGGDHFVLSMRSIGSRKRPVPFISVTLAVSIKY